MAKKKVPQTGLLMKYFVLKPDGKDDYAVASRMAMSEYARMIQTTNMKLANDLFNWVEQAFQEARKK